MPRHIICYVSNLNAAEHPRTAGRILEALYQVPQTAAYCPHAECSTNIINNPVRTRLTTMVDAGTAICHILAAALVL